MTKTETAKPACARKRGGLPLQSPHLQELRLLNGTGRVREGAARFS